MWTHEILEKIWNGENIPELWRTSILVPLYREKGDVLEYGNHRGIKPLERLLKVEEKFLDQKIREVVDMGNMQQLQEKHLEGNKNLYLAVVDLEKAYDRKLEP
ncbi:uncharacterized protein LOC134785023 [Penaeus indicus]|uniref:uncharacterized protein LOC134785023 n=1 Tax=Penaeus indicus TaxID=29960 RepID=UPI00300DB944